MKHNFLYILAAVAMVACSPKPESERLICAEAEMSAFPYSENGLKVSKHQTVTPVEGVAGLEVVEARITYLAYAPEIAAVMLQRQQASAIIDARKMIVDGAVGMVQMALDKINKEGICDLDDERKAQMVANLLVVLCGNRDAQPIVNTGSIY